MLVLLDSTAIAKSSFRLLSTTRTKAFRFTLGIPGFDDALVPRIIGLLGLGLIVWNHVQSEEAIPEPQLRSEAVGVVLSLACVATPTIDKRLKEMNVSVGRRLSAEKPGVDQCFLLDPNLPEKLKQEIAWMSYSLLKCTNVCTFILKKDDTVIGVRGWIAQHLAVEQDPDKSLSLITKGTLIDLLKSDEGQIYVPDIEAEIELKQAFELIQPYSRSACIQPITSSEDRTVIGNLIMISDRSKSFSKKDRQWIQSLAKKLEIEFQF